MTIEAKNPPPIPPSAVDMAYRRGYQHGVVEALSLIQRDTSLTRLKGWAKAIDEWRRRGIRQGDNEPPPSA
jgi:hypothetical protein